MHDTVTQDATGTHLDWRHDGVTARMIDWFWSNMEKGFVLWHPTEHAPLTWSDGTFQNLYIRVEEPGDVPDAVAALVTHAHCVIVAGLGFGPESLDDPDPMGYRVHQWSPTDSGVAGRSSAIGARKPETPADGLIWAKHCAEEIGNWGVFLPQLYELYKAVPRGSRNPFADLSVERRGGTLRYRRP